MLLSQRVLLRGLCSSSRVTTVKLTKNLIKDGMLIVRCDDSNQHIQHLYVNNVNVVLSLLKDLDFFKQVYFRLGCVNLTYIISYEMG